MKIAQFLSLSVMLSALGCQAATSSLFFQGDRLTAVEVGSKGAWTVKGGVLGCNGKHEGYAWLSTDRMFSNFELTLDWRIGAGGNTGVFCRAPDREGRTSMKGFEIQVRDDASDKNLEDVSGAVFSRIPAAGKFGKPFGQWNHFNILCKGRRLRIELNGHLVSDTDMDTIESMRTVPNRGYIGLQNHGTIAEFRNVRIRELD